MKSIKEKQLLVKWSRAMGETIDPALVDEVERYEQIQKDIVESVKSNAIKDLAEAKVEVKKVVKPVLEFPKPPTLEEVLENLKEENDELVQTQAQEIPSGSGAGTADTDPPTLITKAIEHINKEVRIEEQSFQQPVVPVVDKNLEAITQKLKYVEQFIAKIAAHGPGGGAGDVINLDFPVKLVTGDYTVTRKDYYIGVNAASIVNITLPSSIGFPGRKIVIKDESGRCSKFPIVVLGNVDNDPGGFILKINNGGIQMIYRDGWRII